MTRPVIAPELILAWNCKVGRRRSFRAELDRLPDAAIYAFNEADGHYGDLADWAASRNLRRVHAVGGIAVFLAPGVRLIASRVELVEAKWRGPKGKLFRSRPIAWVLVEINGCPLFVPVQHAPWNPIKNAIAWKAYQAKLAQVLTWYPYADALLVGDTNQRWITRAVVSLRRTAARVRGRLVATGAPLDYGVFRPGTTQRWTVVGRRGSRLRSDHHVVTFDLTPRGTAA